MVTARVETHGEGSPGHCRAYVRQGTHCSQPAAQPQLQSRVGGVTGARASALGNANVASVCCVLIWVPLVYL